MSKANQMQYRESAPRGIKRVIRALLASSSKPAPESTDFDIRAYGAHLLAQASHPASIKNARRLPPAYTYARPAHK